MFHYKGLQIGMLQLEFRLGGGGDDLPIVIAGRIGMDLLDMQGWPWPAAPCPGPPWPRAYVRATTPATWGLSRAHLPHMSLARALDPAILRLAHTTTYHNTWLDGNSRQVEDHRHHPTPTTGALPRWAFAAKAWLMRRCR